MIANGLISGTAAELGRTKDRQIRLFLNPSEAMQVISVIQLALKHPKLEEYPDRVESLKKIIEMLSRPFHDCPNCRKMIEVGWKGTAQ